MTNSSKPTIAGVLNIIAAFHGLIIAFLDFVQGSDPGSFSHWSTWVFFAQFLVSLLAGIASLKRRLWLLALVGSVPGFVYYFIGLVALILVIKSRKEFTGDV